MSSFVQVTPKELVSSQRDTIGPFTFHNANTNLFCVNRSTNFSV